MMNRVNYENERNVGVKERDRYMSNHLTCIVCGHMIFGASGLRECPGCKNTIGFSTDKVKVTSIGKMIYNEQIGENEFAFIFEFDYEGFENVEQYFNKLGKEKPVLGVTFMLDTLGNGLGFGGVGAKAVFNDNTEVDVIIEESQQRELTEAILATIFGHNSFSMEDVQSQSKSDELLDNNDSGAPKNVVSLLEISDAMYSIVESIDSIPNRDMWNEIPDNLKEDMARKLQLNEKSFIELMNYAKLKTIDKCSLETKFLIQEIISKTVSEFKPKGKPEKYVWFNNQNDDSVKDLSDYASKHLNKDSLKELKESLTDSKRDFVEYESFEYSNQANKSNMISIPDCNGNECLWVIKSESGYEVFDKVDLYDNYRVFNIPNSNTLEFDNLNDLINLITKISPEKPIADAKKKEKEVSVSNREDSLPDIDIDLVENKKNAKAIQHFIEEEYSDNSIKSSAEKTLKRAERRVKSKKAYRRELLLKQIRELSDEDLLNELKRRMSSK